MARRLDFARKKTEEASFVRLQVSSLSLSLSLSFSLSLSLSVSSCVLLLMWYADIFLSQLFFLSRDSQKQRVCCSFSLPLLSVSLCPTALPLFLRSPPSASLAAAV